MAYSLSSVSMKALKVLACHLKIFITVGASSDLLFLISSFLWAKSVKNAAISIMKIFLIVNTKLRSLEILTRCVWLYIYIATSPPYEESFPQNSDNYALWGEENVSLAWCSNTHVRKHNSTSKAINPPRWLHRQSLPRVLEISASLPPPQISQ